MKLVSQIFKALRDTLLDSQSNKLSHKKLASFSAFYAAIMYAYTPILFVVIDAFRFGKPLVFVPQEFIFTALLGYSASNAYIRYIEKKNKVEPTNVNENEIIG